LGTPLFINIVKNSALKNSYHHPYPYQVSKNTSLILLSIVCKCGNWGIRRRQGDHRIINGIDASPHAYPHQVALLSNAGTTKAPFCGGSIISPSMKKIHLVFGGQGIVIGFNL